MRVEGSGFRVWKRVITWDVRERALGFRPKTLNLEP